MYDEIKNSYQVSLGVSSLIGTRQEQQDSVYGEILEDSVVAIICDGMGGLQHGALASQVAIQTFAEDYENKDPAISIPMFLQQEAIEMDMVVHELVDENNHPIRAGSTAAAVVIQGNNLYFLGVGDSHIYIIRGDEMMVVNRDHNYRLRLDEALESGRITEELYQKEIIQGEALISYLGKGNLPLMDVNVKPFLLQQNDVVMLCSDGLYKTLSDSEIKDICKQHFPDSQKMAEMLTETAIIKSLENQDNTSVVVIHYNGIAKA